MLNAILKWLISLFGILLEGLQCRHLWKCSYQTFQELGLKHPFVLDVGCHDGRTIMTHRDLIGELVGLDIDPEALREARVRGLPVVLGEATRLPFKSSCFDVVTSFHCIEHLKDDLALVNESHRVLKDSGYAIIVTPNRTRLSMVIYKFLTRTKEPLNPAHVFEYTKADLEALFLKSNFGHYWVNEAGLTLLGMEIANVPWFISKYPRLPKYFTLLVAVLQAAPEELPTQGH